MDAGFIDGVDRGAGIRVSGEECALGEWMHFHGFGEETDAVHLRHALVGQEQGHGIVAGLEFTQSVEGGASGIRAHDAITVGVPAAQIALDGSENLGIIIDG